MAARASRDGAPYDLVLIDHIMPDINGLEAGREISRLCADGKTRLVLTSSAGLGDLEALVENVGFDGVLSKPIRPQLLLRQMAACRGVGETDPRIARPSGPSPAASAGDVPFRPIRILLAEDNEVNQKVAIAMLGGLGHEITVANNGREAFDLVQRDEFDLVLMDIHMPEMDGLQALRCIRDLADDVADIPVIALTANAMKGDREKYLSAGMNAYVPKPIDLSNLLEAITQVTGLNAGDAGTGKKAATQTDIAPEDAESILDLLDDIVEG